MAQPAGVLFSPASCLCCLAISARIYLVARTVTASAIPVSSPCKSICVVHPSAPLCIGCGRSLDEIGRWTALSEAERAAIMAQLPARLAKLNSAQGNVKGDVKAEAGTAPARA
jgi:predicted Fe-S protein YdhL (DUF1289 family)